MAHKCEADDANGLENARTKHCKALILVPLELWRNARAIDDHGDDDDNHTNKRECGCTRELVDVTIEREGVRDNDGAQCDDELALGEQGQDRDAVEVRKNGTDDMWYSVPCWRLA